MRHKIARLAAIILIAAVGLSAFSSCTFIKQNENRVANETLITVHGANGITLTVSRNELLDYYNNYAYYLVNYYGYTAKKALDFAIESKVKSKYLATVAMGELLKTSEYPGRVPGVLTGGGKMEKPVDVLTWAEFYEAVKSVNDSMVSTIKSYLDENYQEKLNSAVSDLDHTDVKEIDFSDETKEYLKETYFVGEGIDTDLVKFIVKYDESSGKGTSAPLIAPTSMYDKAFASSAEATDSLLTLKFQEKIVASNGTITYEAHTVSHTYDVVKPRATETKTEDENLDEIKIGDVKISRYETKASIEGKGGKAEVLDINAQYEKLKNGTIADLSPAFDKLVNDKYSLADLRDAFRRLVNNLKSGNKTLDYIYNSSYESAVISALQEEIYKKALAQTEQFWNDEALAEFRFNYTASKATYQALSAAERATQFGTDVKTNLDAYFYHPAVENISGYFYVYQILFNFNDEQKAFLTETRRATPP